MSNHVFISMTELNKSKEETKLLKQVMNNSFTGESTFENTMSTKYKNKIYEKKRDCDSKKVSRRTFTKGFVM